MSGKGSKLDWVGKAFGEQCQSYKAWVSAMDSSLANIAVTVASLDRNG